MSDDDMAVDPPEAGHPQQERQDGAQVTSWAEFEETGYAEGNYTYVVENFAAYLHSDATAKHDPQRVLSDEFEIAGYSWNLLIFPYGNQLPHDQVSVFLACSEAKQLPQQILPKAEFSLMILNRQQPDASVTKESTHTFTAKEEDWGFSKFVDRQRLAEHQSEFMPDGNLHIKVEIKVQIEEKYTGATRKQTGYVGLKNQGATCYMNSLLQTLFHVPSFRRAVYHMPTEEGEDPTSSMSLALKNLFYRLQFSRTPVSTKELVASFGWTNMETFQQHDVEELELKLCEKLEEKMKGTIVDKMVDHLLKGKLYSYIQCVNVDYKSTRSEEFLDIQLDVMGCKNVYDSFKQLITVETMDGDNKYSAEGHGLQDAKKGVLLEALPPVLQLHLKRFDYDRTNWTPIKVNSRYEFPTMLDLTNYMAPTADPQIQQVYTLHSVLVHSGATNGGHYYAYVRADGKQWFRFDDELVTQAKEEEAVEQQFGADPATSYYDIHPKRSLNNAYMLVYIRIADFERVMRPVTGDELDPGVRAQLQAQIDQKETRRKAKMQAHRFVTIKIVTDQLIADHVASETFDLINVDDVAEVNVLKVEKTMPWRQVMEKVQELTQVPAAEQEYLLFTPRANGTVRPTDYFWPNTCADTPVKRYHRQALVNQGGMSSYSRRPALRNYPRNMLTTAKPLEFYVHRGTPSPAQDDVTLFLKWFDVTSAAFSYAGSIRVPKDVTLRTIGNEFFQSVSGGKQLKCFEEVRSDPELRVEQRNVDERLDAHSADDVLTGDVFIFQISDDEFEGLDTAIESEFLTVDAYLTHLHSLRRVTFMPLPGGQVGVGPTAAPPPPSASMNGTDTPPPRPASPSPQLPTVTVEVNKDAKYDEAIEALASKIGVRPDLVRVTQKNVLNGQPQRRAVRSGTDFIETLCLSPSITYEVFYEVLDMPLVEMERLTTTHVKLLKTNTELVMWLPVRLSQKATIAELIEAVRRQAPPSFSEGRTLRAVKCYRHRAYEILADDATLDPQSLDPNYWEIRVEPVPEDDAHASAAADASGAAAGFVCLCHGALLDGAGAGTGRAHLDDYGDPVVCLLEPGETLASVQSRVQARLRVDADDFARWRFALRPSMHSQPTELNDPSIVVADAISTASSTELGGQRMLYPPYICMVHEQKGFAGRRPASHYRGNEATISIS